MLEREIYEMGKLNEKKIYMCSVMAVVRVYVTGEMCILMYLFMYVEQCT